MKCLCFLALWVSSLLGGLHIEAMQTSISPSYKDSIPDLPKVAVVLSGGGAKGAAHVGALRVIEKAGIPIDCVVGTSMGALIGGLYSIGYTTDQLDSLLSSQDWKLLLSDRQNPQNKSLADRVQTEHYALSIPFQAANPEFSNGGVIKGVNLGHLLHQLLSPYNGDVGSFDSLPIPFACVAVDIAHGEAYEFHSGNLQEAMRASMSIPGIFTPVRAEDRVFVDGGIMNNYPTDVAKKMGADIIIGVDVQAALLPAEELKGIDRVVMQVIDVATNNDYFTKIDSTNIYIKVDVSGYSAASFTTSAIDTLKRRGELAALSKWQELKQLRHQLNQAGRLPARPKQPKPIISMEESLESEQKEQNERLPKSASLKNSFAESSINLSVRYDNIEDVALLLGLHLKLPVKQQDLFLHIKGRLGDRSYISTKLNWNAHKDFFLNIGYQFDSDNVNIYRGKRRVANLNYYRHQTRFEMMRSWQQILCQAGLVYDHYRWDGLLTTHDVRIRNTRYFRYYALCRYSTIDDFWYPRRGCALEGKYQFVTDNLITYKGHQGTHIFSARFLQAWSMNRNVVFLPQAGLRFVKHPYEDMYALLNFVGGVANSNIFDGQSTISGITQLQIINNALLTTGLDIRGRASKNQFIIAGGSLFESSPHPETLFENDPYWGVKLGYIYKTIIGPISGSLHYSNLTEKVDFLVNIGFVF